MSDSKFYPYYEARDWLVKYLRRDLEGPGEEAEIISDRPTDAYICGVIYPQNETDKDNSKDSAATGIDGEHHLEDEEGGYDETDRDDRAIALSYGRFPSSIGVTVKIPDQRSAVIHVEVSTARYLECKDIPESSESEGEGDQEKSATWERQKLIIPKQVITMSKYSSVSDHEIKNDLCDGLSLRVLVRKQRDGMRIVTFTLLNTFISGFSERSEKSFFQSTLAITSEDGEPFFLPTDNNREYALDEDEESGNLLYRTRRTFAIGHGCSPTWEKDDGLVKSSRIGTTNIPEFELLLTDSNEDIQSPVLGMKYLANGPKKMVVEKLGEFLGSYETWVGKLRLRFKDELGSSQVAVAERHLDHMERAILRMRSGLELLLEDKNVWTAFQLANRAMLNTRARDVWIRSGSEKPVIDDSYRWYPFQLAFLMLCLEGCAKPEHEDRKFLDLLWFPTGGGKTEAYLVIIAFVILLSRLRKGDDNQGTSVLMRYSMRLLTVQQFERATRLICALEDIRQTEVGYFLGNIPITIGLFVGSDGTPNSHAGSNGTEEALVALSSGVTLERGSPIQIHKCPWCGCQFDKSQTEKNYVVDNSGLSGEKTLVIKCGNELCEFSTSGKMGKLPVYLVDEDLYRNRPTFVIATVDKFAGLPRSPGRTGYMGDLFEGNAGVSSLDLIVQDELHLISGPLGSMTGIYEAIIDQISQDSRGFGPKIVASTATIRNAKSQCMSLFARESFQFPPPALDASDSYFAKEASPDVKGTRLYVGLFAPGTSQQSLLVRTYAALLQGAQEISVMENVSQDVRDAYWTLLGYFNTRLLMGTAGIQARDDIPKRIEYLSEKFKSEERIPAIQEEMWGGIGSGEMTDILDQLSRKYDHSESIDILFATNMISVGVDVDRFGIQAMMGQPLSTSEYIQASSRVGRQYPGLVAVMYNSNKSRDRSHYESFRANHQTLYKEVESSSLTPFSRSARDRALHAVVVSLSRFYIDDLRDPQSAGRILDADDQIKKISDMILERVRMVAPNEVEGTEKDIAEIYSEWKKMARMKGARLSYSVFNLPKNSSDRWPLLSGPDQSDEYRNLIESGAVNMDTVPWETMTSLRNVDTNSSLYLYS